MIDKYQLFKLTEVPEPPQSHYVGIIFCFNDADGDVNILALKDRDRFRGVTNFKLPGGSDEKIYEQYMDFENALFKVLDKLEFPRKTQAIIYKNERKRKTLLEGYTNNKAAIFMLRTMVMESLEEIGFYPMDLEPIVVHYIEKDSHTQYFLEVKNMIGKNGEAISFPFPDDNYRPLDPDVVETRIPLPLVEFEKLIHSHRKAAEKFNLLRPKTK